MIINFLLLCYVYVALCVCSVAFHHRPAAPTRFQPEDLGGLVVTYARVWFEGTFDNVLKVLKSEHHLDLLLLLCAARRWRSKQSKTTKKGSLVVDVAPPPPPPSSSS